jgi:hypothetical protein
MLDLWDVARIEAELMVGQGPNDPGTVCIDDLTMEFVCLSRGFERAGFAAKEALYKGLDSVSPDALNALIASCDYERGPFSDDTRVRCPSIAEGIITLGEAWGLLRKALNPVFAGCPFNGMTVAANANRLVAGGYSRGGALWAAMGYQRVRLVDEVAEETLRVLADCGA